MSTKTYLEIALENARYDGITQWLPSDMVKYLNGKTLYDTDKIEFSMGKNLYDHQITALYNAVKVLYSYYNLNITGDKKAIYDLCVGAGMKSTDFNEKNIKSGKTRGRFARLKNFYDIKTVAGEELIEAYNFFNRACFWMATASGKTLILIKLIEIMDELMTKDLIPRREFMVLFPDERIEKQFAETVDEYNIAKERQIRIESLKSYEDEKNKYTFFNEIKIFSYRSDLLSNEEKTRKIDTMVYDNKGEWYIFLDEAHKGDKEDSVRQDYITILSRNGFLFNFSATFTEAIDYATTCYNFNLERFIENGYGKNIYLTLGKFTFNKNLREDFNQIEKQVQVLKSFIVFTLVKKSKEQDYYHAPLLVTLVNTVQDDEADLVLFFREVEKIAENKIADKTFNFAKEELIREFNKNKTYQFGNDQIANYSTAIESMTLNDIFQNVFNTNTAGRFEIIEGEKGSEFALKLQTASKPFALIRIGEANDFIRKHLETYIKQSDFSDKKFFKNINTDKDLNLLIGSRMFYEGWDSNRPNVINYINIGSGEAKKYVLQSLGRGVRIQPVPSNPSNRRRLPKNDSHYRQLLETLFVFATNRNAVQTILETLDAETANEMRIELKENAKLFDLLVPEYSEDTAGVEPAKFVLAKESHEALKKYFLSFDEELFLLNCGKDVTRSDYARLKDLIVNTPDKLFWYRDKKTYSNTKDLLKKIIDHISIKEMKVSGVKLITDEIIHFNHIKIDKNLWTDSDIKLFETAIAKGIKDNTAEIQAIAVKMTTGKISAEEGLSQMNNLNVSKDEEIRRLKIVRLEKHYFSPLIYSLDENVDFIKPIITVESERGFIKALCDRDMNTIDCEWMFSRVDQTIDKLIIPYFDMNDNTYHEFYPDFIFWQKEKNGKKYKITFVDPKSTAYTSYESKVDYFEKLFYENGRPKVFEYKDFQITFDLKLVSDNDDTVGDKYKRWWLNSSDFSWLNMK
jgi:superfamily II DNA or RNA helicase